MLVDVASGQVSELAAASDEAGDRAVLVAGLGLAGLVRSPGRSRWAGSG